MEPDRVHGVRPDTVSRFRVEKYGARFFAVFDGGELVAVAVYRRGAVEVARRLSEGLREAQPHS